MERHDPGAQKSVPVAAAVTAALEKKTMEEHELVKPGVANTVQIHAPVQTSVVVVEAADER